MIGRLISINMIGWFIDGKPWAGLLFLLHYKWWSWSPSSWTGGRRWNGTRRCRMFCDKDYLSAIYLIFDNWEDPPPFIGTFFFESVLYPDSRSFVILTRWKTTIDETHSRSVRGLFFIKQFLFSSFLNLKQHLVCVNCEMNHRKISQV